MKSHKKLFFKIIITIFVLILVTYCVSVVYKYVILSKISSAYEESKKIENYSYSYISPTSNNIEKIDKKTGLILFSDYAIGGKTYYKYNFNSVASKDVEKPDTNLYTYKNME